jgi:hypothetical protein
MINVVVDLLQSCALILWVVMMVLVTRRVNRLDRRSGEQRIIYQHMPSASLSAPYQEEPKAICGCSHHQCFHDETGCGKSELVTEVRRNDFDRQIVPCGCKRYTGPEQLPQVIP